MDPGSGNTASAPMKRAHLELYTRETLRAMRSRPLESEACRADRVIATLSVEIGACGQPLQTACV